MVIIDLKKIRSRSTQSSKEMSTTNGNSKLLPFIGPIGLIAAVTPHQ